MSGSESSWSTQQLTEFLATVSSFPNEKAAERGAVERVAEAVEAEVAALARGGRIVAAVGFPAGKVAEREILTLLEMGEGSLDVPGAGSSPTAVVAIEGKLPGHIIVARAGAEDFSQEELDLVRGMGRVLSLTLELLHASESASQAAIAEERAKANAVKGAILESALDCVITADHDGRILDFNSAAEQTFGYKRSEVVGKTLAETIVPPELREAHTSGLNRYLETGQAKVLNRRIEMTGMRSDGSRFPAELAITAIDSGGKALFAAYLRDITARKQAEGEMETSMSLLNATLESTADGILVVNRDGDIVNFNQKFVEMWNIPPEVIAAKDDERALSCILDQLKDPDAFLARVRELYDSDEEGFDILEFKDGRVFERYSQPQRIADDNVGRVWSFRDLTDQRRLESELRQAQKMEAVGQLAGGIAHDFNNLLAVIVNYAAFLEEDLDPSDDHLPDVVGIRDAAERGVRLVRQLLVFSRKEIVKSEVLDLNLVVRDLERLLGRAIGENIDLSLRQAIDLWAVKVDRGQIEQILMNLVVNARDAMPQGGELEIETWNTEVGVGHGRRRSFMKPGRYACLSVRDSGTGMTDEVKARVFEPFFTTKGQGEGTGLGLATVYGIVERIGGHIHVDSALGLGTKFDVYIPATRERPKRARKKPSGSAESAGGGRILVVEDEDAVREILTRILVRHGYEVVAASSGGEAIEVFQEQSGAIDLVLTDVIMPGMSGKVLVERLQDLGHGFKTLYMSGYTGDVVAHQGVLEEGEELIQKPFEADELLPRIRELLESVPVAGGT